MDARGGIILETAHQVARETGLGVDEVLEIMEEGLRASARRHYGGAQVEAHIDRNTGAVRIVRVRIVVPDGDVDDEGREVGVSEARASDPHAQPGDEHREEMPSIPWNRHAAQVAQHAINARFRDRMREHVQRVYGLRIGTLARGRIYRAQYGAAFVRLEDGTDGIIFQEDALPGERLQQGMEIEAIVSGVRDFRRSIREYRPDGSFTYINGVFVTLSRTAPAFAVAVARSIVPEMEAGLVEVKGCVREAGVMTKIAVAPARRGVDAVAACIGQEASRVRAMSEALGGETVQIIRWSPSLARYAMYALEPAIVRASSVDREQGVIEVRAGPAHYARAIGAGGLNVRLASELVGMPIRVLPGKGVAANE